MSSNRPSSGTLKRQLVIRITLIVTVVAIILAALSTMLVGRILTGNLDQQLRYAVHATDDRPHGPESMGDEPGGRVDLRVGGLPAGSFGLSVSSSGLVQTTMIWDSGSGQAGQEQIASLLSLPGDGRVSTVRFDDYGDYRAVALTRNGSFMAVAAPLAVTQAIVGRLIWIELALIALAAAAAAGVSTVVVRASLRPLNQLAATAAEVAALPLSAGEVSLGVRVPQGTSSPDSEVGRVGAAFNSMLDHVEDSLQARHTSETRVRQFVADASHELRNPLAAIRGYAELTRRSGDRLPDDTVFALSRIESESQRMSRLVEQMLLLARLDNGPDLEVAEVDLGEKVLNAVSDAQASGPGHEWQVRVPDEPVIVLGDANQLHQVVANLLGNARKHTPAGTVVRTSVTSKDGMAQIEVSDNGPGVPPEVLDHIFERFTRADQARAHDREGSTGLGLAIVAAVAKAHGGQVSVASTQHGATFTVRLPLATGVASSKSQQAG